MEGSSEEIWPTTEASQTPRVHWPIVPDMQVIMMGVADMSGR
jgi:hypothetical protein